MQWRARIKLRSRGTGASSCPPASCRRSTFVLTRGPQLVVQASPSIITVVHWAHAHRASIPKHSTDSVTSSVRLSPLDPRLRNLDRLGIGRFFGIATCRVSRGEMVENKQVGAKNSGLIMVFPERSLRPLDPDRAISPCKQRPRGREK